MLTGLNYCSQKQSQVEMLLLGTLAVEGNLRYFFLPHWRPEPSLAIPTRLCFAPKVLHSIPCCGQPARSQQAGQGHLSRRMSACIACPRNANLSDLRLPDHDPPLAYSNRKPYAEEHVGHDMPLARKDASLVKSSRISDLNCARLSYPELQIVEAQVVGSSKML